MRRLCTPMRFAAVIALLMLIVLLVPMFMIARYDVPLSDDYSYGQDTSAVWDATHSWISLLKTSFQNACRYYQTWQGSYSALFVMTLQPGIFGIEQYFWTFPIMLFALLIGLWCITRTVLKNALRAPFGAAVLLFSLEAILCTQFLPNPNEALFWFNGSCYYSLYFSLSLLLLSIVISFCFRQKGRKANAAYYVFLPLLAFVIAGGNYTTGLQTLLLLAAATVWQFVSGKKNPLLLITTLLFLGFFLFNIKCPANAARQFYSGPVVLVRSGIKAVLKTIAAVTEWTTLPVLLASFAAVPLSIDFSRRSGFRFRFPWLVLLASFFLLASGYMPTLYTQDYTGSGRLQDIQFFLYILLLFVNVFYLSGSLFRQLQSPPAEPFRLKTARALFLGWCVAFLFSCVGSYSSFSAYKAADDLMDGTAETYFRQQQERWEICQSSEGQDVVLAPLDRIPVLFLKDDMGSSPLNWRNEVYAMYFRLNSVRIAEPPSSGSQGGS